MSLNRRLLLCLLGILLTIGLLLVFAARYAAQSYFQEINQNLNRSISMYVVDRMALFAGPGKVDMPSFRTFADQAMTVNPSVEVYLLDAQGQILAHALPPETQVSERVAMAPIAQFLGGARLPVVGDDPRDPGSSQVFSVHPIDDPSGAARYGYLYVVLGGQKYQSLLAMFSSSYVMRLTSIVIVGALLAGALLGGWLFGRVTKPLRRLRQRVVGYGEQGLHQHSPPEQAASGIPEIDDLADAFETMQGQLTEQFQQLDQNDRLRRELIANVSHDLRTPLAAMQGYVETLLVKDDVFDAAQRKHHLEVAHNHTRQLSRLVTELFDLAKMDSGTVQPEVDAFSLTELLQDVVQEFQLQAKQQQVELTLAGITDDVWVRGDIGLIQRVCENLVSNALRHTPAGGAVRFSVNLVDERIEVALTDTGCGIPAEELPWIFDRYYRASSLAPEPAQAHATPAARGTGLGLAIVKKILELHDSAISVESQVNQGTTFRFRLESGFVHAA